MITSVDDMTMEEWAADQVAQGLSARTITERAQIVARFAAFCGVPPQDAAKEHVVAYLAGDPTWTPGTRVTYYSSLQAWFAWLIMTGRREDDPTTKMRRPKNPRGLPHPISDYDLERLLASRMWPSTRAKILLGAYAGLRAHEIAKVRGEDIGRDQLRVQGKGARVDYLPLHPVLEDLAESMPKIGWWFPSPADPGKPVSRTSVSAVISRATHRLGIKQGTAHSLRHWYGTALVRAGVDLRTVQELMRHSSLATTAIYTAVDDAQRRAGVARLPVGTAA